MSLPASSASVVTSPRRPAAVVGLPAAQEPPERPSSGHTPRFQCLEMGPESFVWRLVAANGRTLGRSPHAYPSLRAALDAIAFLQRAHRQTRTVRVLDGGHLRWRLVAHEAPVAESAAGYARHIEVEHAVERFLAVAAHALLDPTVGAPRARAPQGRTAP